MFSNFIFKDYHKPWKLPFYIRRSVRVNSGFCFSQAGLGESKNATFNLSIYTDLHFLFILTVLVT